MSIVLILWLWIMRRSLVGLVALTAGIIAFDFVQPVAIASFGDLEKIQRLIDFVPPAFLALLNVTPEFLSQAGLPGYLALGFSHPVYFLLTSAAVIWFAAATLAGEMERGSIQIALSRPVSRTQVFLSRVIGIVVIAAVVSIAGPVGTLVGIAVADPSGSIDRRHFVTQFEASWLLVCCIGGVALLLSSIASRMAQAVGWSIALLVISYVIDYFADLWDALEPIEPFSIFNYYNAPLALSAGTIPSRNLVVLGALGILAVVGGWFHFRRRDLPN